MTPPPKERYLIPMLERSLRALELLSQSAEGLSLAELSQQLGAPKSSVFNILATLEHHGYIRPDNGTGRFVLTPKLYRVGSPAVNRMSLRQTLHPTLAELVEQTGETANLGILEGGAAYYIDSIEGPSRVRVAVAPGERLDLHATALGKVLLAHQPPPALEALLQGQPLAARTPNTVTEMEALRHELALIREQGYALDNEEDHLDIRCIGAPVHDYTGAVVAAVSLTAPKHRLVGALLTDKTVLVLDYAGRMSRALGYGSLD